MESRDIAKHFNVIDCGTGRAHALSFTSDPAVDRPTARWLGTSSPGRERFRLVVPGRRPGAPASVRLIMPARYNETATLRRPRGYHGPTVEVVGVSVE